jgi:hypothetical protein
MDYSSLGWRIVFSNPNGSVSQSIRSINNLFCGDEYVVDATSPRTREPNPSDTVVMISKELTLLSPQEREKAWNDLHGGPDAIPEDPEFVAQQLYQMHVELTKLETKKNAAAYQLVKQLDQGYVDNWSFRMMFLRAEMFQAKLAAKRVIRFFEEKLPLFGPEKLCKDILLEDLAAEDIRVLESGSMQVLPEKDGAGRTVMLGIPNLKPALWDMTTLVCKKEEKLCVCFRVFS